MSRQANMATPAQLAAWRAGKLGRRAPTYTRGEMNKTEAAYASQLELLKRAGRIKLWEFEPEKMRLALKTFYTADFRVVTSTGEVEFHEVKGRKRNGRPFCREDAMLKLKFAAERYRQHRFILVWPDGKGGWCSELVKVTADATATQEGT